MEKIEIFPLEGIPLIKPGDNIGEIIVSVCKKNKQSLQNGDVLIIAQSIISKAENAIIDLNTVEPSNFAKKIAKNANKDPRVVEVVLREAQTIVRMRPSLLICETKEGWVCANAGVDQSNVEKGFVTTLPKNADQSARKIRQTIKEKLGVDVAVIISDSFGRPFRIGVTNVAIGVSGLQPLEDLRGRKKDLYGRTMEVTVIARADELAAAAGLIMGQADEGYPIIVIRNAVYTKSDNSSAKVLARPRETSLFW